MRIYYGTENLQSLAGVAVIIGLCWLISRDRQSFPLRLMCGAIGLQVGLILLLFAIPNSKGVLETLSAGVEGLSAATNQGVRFMFGYLGGGDQPFPVVNSGALLVFAFNVLPLIIVIAALSSLLWHWRILKWIIRGFGYVFQKTIGLGGASSLGVASGIFLGNVESLILIRAYLDKLTRSELFTLMVVGMANVAGSTMVAYVLILGGVLPNAAGHILAASIISAPAAVLLARIILPETPEYRADKVDYSSSLTYDSSIDAITKGTSEGLNVAVNVAAILIVMVALVALINVILSAFGLIGGEPLSLERMLGFVFTPLAWLIGVPASEAGEAGRLLGIKMALTEFVAYMELSQVPIDQMTPRTRMLLTYALCGFANVASVGITVSGYGVLMPDRREEIMKGIWKALAAGFLATCLSAAVVGALPNAIYGL